jgi:hypothetical protein
VGAADAGGGFAEHADLLPTLLDLAGVGAGPDFDGDARLHDAERDGTVAVMSRRGLTSTATPVTPPPRGRTVGRWSTVPAAPPPETG